MRTRTPPLPRRSILVACACVTALLPTCGARTGLWSQESLPDASAPEAGPEAADAHDAGSDTLLETSPDAPFDNASDESLPDSPWESATDVVAEDSPQDSSPPPHCLWTKPNQKKLSQLAGSSFTPSLVVARAGQQTTQEEALVALAYLSSDTQEGHSSIKLLGLRAKAPPDPGDVVLESGPTLVGSDSHTWAEMAPVPGAPLQAAIGWMSDPGMVGRAAFRRLDLASWTALGNPVDLSLGGSSVHALAPGQGTGPLGAGYAGLGFGAVWEEMLKADATYLAQPVAAVLDTSGQRLLGPHPVAGWNPDMRSVSMVWSSQTYLLATAYDECPTPGPDPLCVPQSVILSRFRPASGDAVDDSGIEFASSITTPTNTIAPQRPVLINTGARNYLLWVQRSKEEVPVSELWLVELDAQGVVLTPPKSLVSNVLLAGMPVAAATSLGIVVAWPQAFNPSSDTADLRWKRFQENLEEIDEGSAGNTEFYSWGHRAIVALDYPKALLFAWTAHNGSDRLVVARTDCLLAE